MGLYRTVRFGGHGNAVNRESRQVTTPIFGAASSASLQRHVQVYVSRAKRQVLEALQLPREYTSLLTDNDREAAIQAVGTFSA